MKYILFWTPYFNASDFFIGFGSKAFSECEHTNCFTTNNRSYLNVDKFDAILFHSIMYRKGYHKEPAIRNPNQIYVYVNTESPIYTGNLKIYDSFFNWTMTYRFDSDIIKRHKKIVKEETDYVLPTLDAVKNKTKIIAWFVSHCSSSSKRELLIKHIMKYIPVDIYGACGFLNCSRNTWKMSTNRCYDMLEKSYKFYFAGENSICKDYTTEKLYYLLEKDIVPVVYGGGNYTASAPPNSVINVADFENVTQLVDYLKFLDANPIEYLKYFKWKKHYKIVETLPVTSKYSDIIDNKKTDGVTLAKKKLAWEEIAVNFNCQNQNGNRSAKQLHDLYDNLKRTARVNLQCDKKNAYKTGGGTFIKKSTPLDQKIVTTLKPQFTPLPNRYDSSTSYIDPQPSCSSKHTPTACNMVTNTVLTYDVVPSGDLQLVTPHQILPCLRKTFQSLLKLK
ncbi:hypothetical protein RN001_007950 [Aquatica leii]|uniref:Fucosyltransferase n=1 Tax=Aquatica leii TaxID=1421715 RepID=A0AAN7P9M0_9COLE|nr:hypothetical protein RN001_007950 [Aquatica leii]